MDRPSNLFAGEAVRVIEENPAGFESILEYLMYEKSLISFVHDGRRIDDYLDLVRGLSKGNHVAVDRSFEKMLVIVFELVLSRKIDPWNIDLVSFGKEYLKRLETEKDINLISIGKIVFMAWGVLKEKSEITLEDAIKIQEEEADDYSMMLGSMDFGLDENASMGHGFMDNGVGSSAIVEMIWRDGERKATLLDVVEALREAQEEAHIRKVIEENRRKLKEERMKAEENISVDDNSHKDDIENDKAITWSRINKYNGHPIRLSQICDFKDRKDVISTLMSSVHLAHEKKINIWQRQFPYGEIYIKNLLKSRSN